MPNLASINYIIKTRFIFGFSAFLFFICANLKVNAQEQLPLDFLTYHQRISTGIITGASDAGDLDFIKRLGKEGRRNIDGIYYFAGNWASRKQVGNIRRFPSLYESINMNSFALRINLPRFLLKNIDNTSNVDAIAPTPSQILVPYTNYVFNISYRKDQLLGFDFKERRHGTWFADAYLSFFQYNERIAVGDTGILIDTTSNMEVLAISIGRQWGRSFYEATSSTMRNSENRDGGFFVGFSLGAQFNYLTNVGPFARQLGFEPKDVSQIYVAVVPRISIMFNTKARWPFNIPFSFYFEPRISLPPFGGKEGLPGVHPEDSLPIMFVYGLQFYPVHYKNIMSKFDRN